MKVSVIVMTNRHDGVVATALRSLAAQEYRPMELVLFGNGAELEAPPEVEAAGIPVRTGSSPENLGVAGGRNAAAALATGELLFLLDDDAVLHPGAIERAVAALNEAPDIAAVALRIIDPRSGRTGNWIWPFEIDEWDERRFDVTNIIGCGALVRRDVFERLGGFWTGYFREMEEVDFSWRLLDAGWRIRYEPAAVVEHPAREGRRLYRWSIPGTIAMGWRLLPPGLALRQAGVKLPLFAVRALRHGELRDFAQGLAATPAAVRRARRDPARLHAGTVAHLRRLHARGGWGRRLQWSLRRLAPPDVHAS